MTNYNNTDKIIREKYETLDPVFDADSMWADLSPLVEKKRRRGFFFWTFSGALIIALSLVCFSLFVKEEIATSVTELNIKNTESVKSSMLTLDNNSSNARNNEDVSSISNNDDTNESVVMDAYIKSDEEIVASSKVVMRPLKSTKVSGESSSSFSFNQKVKSSIAIDDFLSIKKSNSFIASNNLVEESRDLITFSDLALFNISSLELSTRGVPIAQDEMIESVSTQPLQSKKWRLGVNGGYYIHSRSFEDVGDDVSNNYSSRLSEEKAKDGYDVGVKLEYFLSDHVVIFGGVRFSQSFVERKADYSYTETITLEDHVVEIIITEQGPVEVKENITYDGVFNHNADNYITATRLGLISGIQYRIGADRWTTHVDLGVELPVWSSHSGIITNNRRPYNLSDDTEFINTSSSIQIFGGVGIEYSLSTSTALQATIGGYMPLKNEHVESYAIEKKSTLLGVNLGIHFRL